MQPAFQVCISHLCTLSGVALCDGQRVVRVCFLYSLLYSTVGSWYTPRAMLSTNNGFDRLIHSVCLENDRNLSIQNLNFLSRIPIGTVIPDILSLCLCSFLNRVLSEKMRRPHNRKKWNGCLYSNSEVRPVVCVRVCFCLKMFYIRAQECI